MSPKNEPIDGSKVDVNAELARRSGLKGRPVQRSHQATVPGEIPSDVDPRTGLPVRDGAERTLAAHPLFQQSPAPETDEVPRMTIILPSERRMTIHEIGSPEERIFTNEELQRKGEAFDRMLCACADDLDGTRPVTYEQILLMLSGDRTYAAVMLRILSYGDTQDLDTKCPACKRKNRNVISYEKHVLPTLKMYPKEREFAITLSTGRRIVYGFLTGMEEKAISSRGDDDRSLVDGMLHRIRSVDGKPWHMGLRFRSREMMELRSELSKNSGGIETTVEVVCTGAGCGQVYPVRLEGQSSFFLPGIA